jgi:hypothetical protein
MVPKLFVPGIVHVLAKLRDSETGNQIEVDVGFHEYECIIIEPFKREEGGDSLARVILTFTDDSLKIEMGGPMVELVKAPWLREEGGGSNGDFANAGRDETG